MNIAGRRTSCCDSFRANYLAATFEQDDIAPYTFQFAEPFASSDFAKTGATMNCQTGNIFRQDSGLQRPDAVSFRFCNQRLQQHIADALPSATGSPVAAYLSHAAIDTAARHRAERRPTEDFCAASCYQSAVSQMSHIPDFPLWRGGFKGRISCRNSFDVNFTNRLP